MTHIEIQEGELPMRHKMHHRELGATAACTVCLAEASLATPDEREEEGNKKLVADSWFGGWRALKALCKQGV